MPRIRTIKPEALQHRKVGKLSDRALRAWLTMLTQADDHGRLVADAAQVRLLGFGYQERTTTAHIEAAMQEVAAARLVCLYVVDGIRYACFPSWADHQRVERPYTSKLPECKHSPNDHRTITEQAENVHGGSDQGSRIGRDQGSEGIRAVAPGAHAPDASALTRQIEFRIPASVSEALSRAPLLGRSATVRRPEWWQAQLRANPGVDFAAELLKAEAWCTSHPDRTPKKRPERFLHSWFARAERPEGD